MKKYRFYWADFGYVDGYGNDPAEAFTKLGYSQGSLAAVNYYECINDTPAPPSHCEKAPVPSPNVSSDPQTPDRD